MPDAIPESTEFAVLGGGPAGYTAAFRSAAAGMDVTLVSEDGSLGGVCLHRGCIPSKVLLDKAEILRATRRASRAGLEFGSPEIDLGRLRDHTRSVVDRLAGGLDRVAEGYGVRIVTGRGRFVAPDRLEVDDGTDPVEIGFGRALIATGSRPAALPGIDFGGPIMDSSAALELAEIPDRLLVVGCGFLGVGLGSLYSSFGSCVTMVEMADQILPGIDPDLVAPLRQRLDEELEDLRLEISVSNLRRDEDGVWANLDGDERRFDRVLVAVGRRPNIDGLGLEEAGVELDEGGFVVVDDRQQTSSGSIQAAGDVCGGMMFAHEAMHEGRIAAEAAAGRPVRNDARAMPAVVYAEPEIAWCGLSEIEAEERQIAATATRFPWSASGRAHTMDAAMGLTKLVTDTETGRVLGVGIVGPGAETLISEAVLAIEMGAVADDLDLIVHPHPTLSETIGGAARRLLGHPLNLPPGDD